MANSNAQVFVPRAAQQLSGIVSQILAVQKTIQELQQQWTQLGKTNMRGWNEIDWTAYAFTPDELRIALNGLDDTYAMALVSLQTALPKLQKVIS